VRKHFAARLINSEVGKAVNETEQRLALVAHGRSTTATGINHGRSGNLSVRLPDGFLVTPSAIAYEAMQPDDIVKMRWDGTYGG
jgi:L-fuculose-phosphate aldolase